MALLALAGCSRKPKAEDNARVRVDLGGFQMVVPHGYDFYQARAFDREHLSVRLCNRERGQDGCDLDDLVNRYGALVFVRAAGPEETFNLLKTAQSPGPVGRASAARR